MLGKTIQAIGKQLTISASIIYRKQHRKSYESLLFCLFANLSETRSRTENFYAANVWYNMKENLHFALTLSGALPLRGKMSKLWTSKIYLFMFCLIDGEVGQIRGGLQSILHVPTLGSATTHQAIRLSVHIHFQYRNPGSASHPSTWYQCQRKRIPHSRKRTIWLSLSVRGWVGTVAEWELVGQGGGRRALLVNKPCKMSF